MHIEVKNLNKNFGSFHAIKDVNFSITKGHLVGLIGPSGGGKTSILRMLSGLESPTTGDIYFDGKLATHLPVQERGIGFVFQSYALFKHMTVFDNVAYGLKVLKKPKEFIHDRVTYLLNLMGLAGNERKYPHQLSGGQRQRVAFARALAPEPQLLLLDEPFAAIDAKIRKELRLWLRNLIDEFKVTTLFVTHDQDEAIEVADEIILVQGGKIEQQGSPWEIYTKPASSFVASFIGESNVISQYTPLVGFPYLDEIQQDGKWLPDVNVLIRPEAIEVRPHDVSHLATAGEKGKVTHVHFRGDSWYLEIDTGAIKLFAYQSVKEKIYQPGDDVNILIHQISVFTKTENIVIENQAKQDPLPVFI
ncbi:ABC transporter ATP-binding protein [Paenibacillus chondroitinus]|uniref:ABC transporter ATP-binding protein n=1 Tax=Paenibacillus chondroitinus TaxID=59842 RepID=A0ABU6DIR8_9BACL|nr:MULTISPECIES: ABC transporter ATP-binding protein [Paenibacillus]MCY9662002.1 ABC transporter ATP-binding protein [Paenibacillus anseongense]MEB4797633.1 ABC transporter ATP-binding protein [Paenibacillus chondroitinus]